MTKWNFLEVFCCLLNSVSLPFCLSTPDLFCLTAFFTVHSTQCATYIYFYLYPDFSFWSYLPLFPLFTVAHMNSHVSAFFLSNFLLLQNPRSWSWRAGWFLIHPVELFTGKMYIHEKSTQLTWELMIRMVVLFPTSFVTCRSRVKPSKPHRGNLRAHTWQMTFLPLHKNQQYSGKIS